MSVAPDGPSAFWVNTMQTATVFLRFHGVHLDVLSIRKVGLNAKTSIAFISRVLLGRNLEEVRNLSSSACTQQRLELTIVAGHLYIVLADPVKQEEQVLIVVVGDQAICGEPHIVASKGSELLADARIKENVPIEATVVTVRSLHVPLSPAVESPSLPGGRRVSFCLKNLHIS